MQRTEIFKLCHGRETKNNKIVDPGFVKGLLPESSVSYAFRNLLNRLGPLSLETKNKI